MLPSFASSQLLTPDQVTPKAPNQVSFLAQKYMQLDLPATRDASHHQRNDSYEDTTARFKCKL